MKLKTERDKSKHIIITPTDLANSLGGNATDEQNDAPHHLAPSNIGPSQLPHDNDHQSCPTHTGGAKQKTTVKPTAPMWVKPKPRRMPNPVDQADDWIWVQMSQEGRHPHWWKQLRALYWGCLVGNLSEIHALQFAQWQAAAFRITLAQAEASGWWEAPHSLSTLHHQDFLPQVDLPGLRVFCVTRQEEILTFAWALQCCVERSGMPPRVLCKVAWDLQRCMAPLMQLDRDESVEASLLGPTNDMPWMPPTLEEEAVLLGDEPELQEAQEVTTSSPECPQTPELEELTEQSDTPSLPVPSPPTSNSHGNWSKNMRSWCRARLQCLPTPDPDNPHDWVQAYIEEREQLLNWWQEFRSLDHKGTIPLSDSQVQELARKQAAAFRLPAPQKEKGSWWNAQPSLASLRCRYFLPASPTRIQGPRDIWVVRHDETVTQAQALQQCAIWLGAPQGILCGTAQDFSRCLHVGGHGGGETLTSSSPAEEAGSWGEKPEPREVWPTTVHAPSCPEEALEPKKASSLGVMAIAWRQLPPAPPGFTELLFVKSEPSPLEDAGSPLGIPWRAWLDLSSMGSMQVVITQNTLMGQLGYHYQTRVISWTSLHLALPNFLDQPNPCWKIEGTLSE